ncbi:MAG: DUF1640 domain-containing protein [Alphaproteobacteria bacterium]
MATIPFDALKFVHRIRDAGIPEPQAEASAEAFKDASGEAEIATKRDIKRLDADTRTEMLVMKWMTGGLLAGVTSLVLKAFLPH